MELRLRSIAAVLAVALGMTLPGESYAQQNVPVIAVGEIQSSFANWDTATVQTALESALTRTRKFSIMERGRLDELLQERGLSVAGIADGITSLGGFSGVDYLLYGRVMDAGFSRESMIIMSQCKASVSLDVRTVDVSTGEIRFSESVEVAEVVASGGGDQNPCQGVSTASLAPLSTLAAEAVAEKLTIALFPVKLVRVVNNEVYLNYGAPFLVPGEYMKVVTLGEGFVDPDTGEVLGADEEESGYLLVRDVRPKYSIADVVYRYTPTMAVGDVAMKLTEGESKGVRKMLSDIDKADAKKQRDCKNARKRESRQCAKNPSSSRCLDAQDNVARHCTT